MTEEYRIIHEKDANNLLLEEAQKVGENINVLVAAIHEAWNPSLEELEKAAPYPHLTEYALAVMEGMGLVAHTDMDDPYWNHIEPKRTGPGYRAVDRTTMTWQFLAGIFRPEDIDWENILQK